MEHFPRPTHPYAPVPRVYYNGIPYTDGTCVHEKAEGQDAEGLCNDCELGFWDFPKRMGWEVFGVGSLINCGSPHEVNAVLSGWLLEGFLDLLFRGYIPVGQLIRVDSSGDRYLDTSCLTSLLGEFTLRLRTGQELLPAGLLQQSALDLRLIVLAFLLKDAQQPWPLPDDFKMVILGFLDIMSALSPYVDCNISTSTGIYSGYLHSWLLSLNWCPKSLEKLSTIGEAYFRLLVGAMAPS